MYRVAICDGEPTSLTLLRALTEKILSEEEVEFEIIPFKDADELLARVKDGEFYHILLADVKNRSQGGFVVAEELYRQQAPTAIIFLVGHSRYTVDAYRMEVMRYLLKPVSMVSLREALVSAVGRANRENHLAVTVSGRRMYIPVRDIYYIQQGEGATVIRLLTSTVTVREPVEELANELDGIGPGQFVFCNQNQLVQIHHIDTVARGKVIMTNRDELVLTRSRQQKVQDMFLSFR